MAKTLVIKSANFNTNKLATVSFDGVVTVPCQSITLGQSTLSLEVGQTQNLTKTVTPSNTTDTVVWSSSNSSIATVSNGLVSAISQGSATISATCGTKQATLTLTVTQAEESGGEDTPSTPSVATYNFHQGYEVHLVSTTNNYSTLGEKTNCCALGVDGDGRHLAWTNATTKSIGQTFIPISIPSGKTKVTLTTTLSTLIHWQNTNEYPTSLGTNFCKMVSYEENYTVGSRVVDIPSNANGLYINVNSSEFSSDMLTITFS